MTEPYPESDQVLAGSISIARAGAEDGSARLHARTLDAYHAIAKRERITVQQACVLALHGRDAFNRWRAA